MNNKLLLIINALLVLAVGYLLFKDVRGGAVSSPKEETAATGSAPLRVVFVNEDSLLANYAYMNKKQEEFAVKEREADAQLKARGQALEKEFMAAQDKIQKGLLAPNQIAAEEQRLGKKQQALAAEQERLTRDLMAQGQALQEELNTAVKELLKSIQKEFGYDYIVKYGPGSDILMIKEEHDITGLVLERLNKKEQ